MRITLTLITLLSLLGCSKAQDNIKQELRPKVSLSLESGNTGFIYLDGKFIGKKSPYAVAVNKGNHIFSIGDPATSNYFRVEANISKDTVISLSSKNIPTPRTWKALWIGVHEAENPMGGSTHFSTSDLDTAYSYFKWSIAEHFEKLSYHATKWDVERLDISTPVRLTQSGDNQIIEYSTIKKLVPTIQPGSYDCVFVFFRQQEGNVNHVGNYFGLAWTDPLTDTDKTGYVIVKFDMGNSIESKLAYYKNNDPGLFVHEWLHTVGEIYFTSLGCSMPVPAGGLRVHAAELYGYSFPWMAWYQDYISGRIYSKDGSGYCGIGPEMLLNNSLRKTALGSN